MRVASKETSRETQGMQARKHCKGHDDARDLSKAALRGRQRREGGNHQCIVVVDATCNSSHINSLSAKSILAGEKLVATYSIFM